MKRISLHIEFEEYENADQLPDSDKQLFRHAGNTADMAYAPFSGFMVGTAIRLENGIIITGNNQENVAFPSGLCAERVAFFAAKSKYPEIKILAAAISAKSLSYPVNHAVTPCGACRQVMAEYEQNQGSKIRIIFPGDKGKIYVVEGVDMILPLMFRFDPMKK